MKIYRSLKNPSRLAIAEASDSSGNPLILDGFPGATGRSIFDPYIGEGTVWQRDISSMPVAPNSRQLATWMWEKTPTPWNPSAFGAKTALNRSTYGTHPIPTYVIDSSHPRCPVATITGAAVNGGSASDKTFVTGEVPWPDHVIPAQNQDYGLAVWDQFTGIMREWFYVRPNGTRRWTASNGGFSVALPGLVDLKSTNYATQMVRGSNAVAGMHNTLGFIGASEIRKKAIPHALAFTTANFAEGLAPSWPARLTDGKAPHGETSPTHGQWARLPKSVDPNRNPRTGQPYNPLTQMLIVAAQKYGLVGTDTNAWCHAFNAESGYEAKALTGKDPWEDDGELARIISPGNTAKAFDVSDFPWDLTEWAPVDWGRPSPDMWIRPSEHWPWRAS